MLYLSRAPSAKRFDAENNVRRVKREVEKWLREIMQTVAKLCSMHSQIADVYLFFHFCSCIRSMTSRLCHGFYWIHFILFRNNVDSPNITPKTKRLSRRVCNLHSLLNADCLPSGHFEQCFCCPRHFSSSFGMYEKSLFEWIDRIRMNRTLRNYEQKHSQTREWGD